VLFVPAGFLWRATHTLFGQNLSGLEKPWIVRGAADEGNIRHIGARIAHPQHIIVRPFITFQPVDGPGKCFLASEKPLGTKKWRGAARQMREMSGILGHESRTHNI
jgi:hypothetical protein